MPAANAPPGRTARALERAISVFCVATLVLLVVTGVHVLGLASDDATLIQTFSSDEHRAMHKLQQNVDHDDLNPRGFYAYGYLYHTLCFATLRVFEELGIDTLAPRTIVFVTRATSLAAFLGLVAVFYGTLASIRTSAHFRLVFTALLASSAGILRWSHQTHPDMLLTLLGTLVLWVLLQGLTPRRLLLASALTGLAFGTKASGAYYVVLVAATFFADRLRDWPRDWRTEVLAWLRLGLPAVAVFLAAWLISNPYVLVGPGGFLRDFLREQGHVMRGHLTEMDITPLDWLQMLIRGFSIGGFSLLTVGWLSGLGLGRLAYRGQEQSDALPPLPTVIGTLVFAIVGFGHLALIVDLWAERYLMPLLPALVWLSALGWSLLLTRFPRVPSSAVALMLAVAVAWNAWWGAAETREVTQRGSHPHVVAGLWLAEHYPGDTRVLLERYSYAPEAHFDRIEIVTRMTWRAIEQHPADVIVMNLRKSGRWSWRRAGTRFEDRDFVVSDLDKSAETNAFHMQLFAPESGWRVVYESDEIVILERGG